MHSIKQLKIWFTSVAFILGALAFTTSHAVSPEDLLKPAEAFQISANGSKSNKILVKWRIADGYYLYTNKIRFSTDTSNLTLSSPNFPESEIKDDQFFGEIEILRGEPVIEIPYVADTQTPDIINLIAKSQGCADAGICYPPQTQQILVGLSSTADSPAPIDPNQIEDIAVSGSGDAETASDEPAKSLASIEPGNNDPLAGLSEPKNDLGFGFDDDEILTPEQAFKLSESVTEDGKLNLFWQIAQGTYLYNDKVQIKLPANSDLQVGSYDMPKPKTKPDGVRTDGTIGEVQIYKESLELTVPFINKTGKAGSVELTIKHQGCAERGICYPPNSKQIVINYDENGRISLSGEAPASDSTQVSSNDNQSSSVASEENQIADLIRDSSTFAVVGIFFLIGLGLAFTPCVFPMIPILSGIITGQGKDITTGRATYLSVIYVLAMAVTYTVAGVFAAMSGENLQILLQIPWVIAVFSAIFVLLALSMFGFYELQLPSSLQSKITELSNKQSGGNTIGVAIMGLLSALIVGPCVAPPLAGALLYIGQTNDPVLGGLALFAMSMGMGVPLILIGASAGKLLPHAGAWMDAVKAVFGVSMLALAIYFLERILPETIIMVLWGMLMIGSSVYMGAVSQLPVEATGWQKLWKGLGIGLLIYGALMLVGVAANSNDVRQPLRGVAMSSSHNNAGGESVRHFQRITTMQELDKLLGEAKSAGKPAILDFYADWCVYCKTLEKEIFPHPQAQAAMADAVLIQADVTDAGSEQAKAIMKRFGVIAPPVIVFWDKQGNELPQHKIVGDVPLAEFISKTRNAIQ